MGFGFGSSEGSGVMASNVVAIDPPIPSSLIFKLQEYTS